MASEETGKFRATRIPLDYYKRPDALSRWRQMLVVFAVLLAGGLAAASLLPRKRGAALVSRGPVAAVHAAWDNDCQACHTSFQPISTDAVLAPVLTSHDKADQNCTTCHAGPPHHQTEKKADVPGCAGCHHEHRGRDADLNRVADSDCTRCHANLMQHMAAEGDSPAVAANVNPPDKEDLAGVRQLGLALRTAANVTGFDQEHHPQFKLFAEGSTPRDPGRLKFNHQLHMTAGLQASFTLGKLDEAVRKRYRAGQKEQAQDSDLVQLGCASCHQLDSQSLPAGPGGKPGSSLQQALLPARNGGRYFLPVNYENACAACHPLTLGRTDRDDPRSGHVAVPHGLQPKEMHDILQGYYTAELLKGNAKLFDRPAAVRPLPGKPPTGEAQTARADIEKKVSAAEKLLYSKNTCFECHYGTTKPGEAAPEAIEPTNVPAVWFQHATFDHTAHRAVSCKECHPRAYPDVPDASTVHTDVLIPDKMNCLQCHAPRTGAGNAVSGGARTDCVECHRYHNGDRWLQGIGAPARNPAAELGVEKFLSGGR
jgi:hypothetical protein